MSDLDPCAWAGEVARALSVGGERVPFQRVLGAHRQNLDALRARGLTWHSLAQFLLRAGVHRPDGRPYSADHLRVCADRLFQDPPRGIAATGQRVPARPPRRPAPPTRARPHGAVAAHAPRAGESPVAAPPPARTTPVPDDKDVSVDEIVAARTRLNQTR